MSESTDNISTSNMSTQSSNLLQDFGLKSNNLTLSLSYYNVKVPKQGFINQLRKQTTSLDIDLSCLLFNQDNQLIETIGYQQLRNSNHAIRHHGDSLEGYQPKDTQTARLTDGNTDATQNQDKTAQNPQQDIEHGSDIPYPQEYIEIYLDSLPDNVHHISLIVSTFNKYALNLAKSGNVYLNDDEGNHAIHIDLSHLPADCHTLWIADICRDIEGWQLTIKNQTLTDDDEAQIAQNLMNTR